MKDEIIRRNAFITGISLLIFFFFSFSFSSYYNLRSMETQLINMSNVVSNQIMETSTDEELNSVVDSFTKNQEWLQITICNSHGNIVKDSENDMIGVTISASISDSELVRANEASTDNDRIYVDQQRIYYIKILSNDIIMRTSTEYSFNTSFLYMNLLVLLILLIIGLFLSIFFSKKTSENIVEIMEKIDSHLKTINEGEYKEIEDSHRYSEVENVLREINEVNKNILKSMQSIRFEHSKIDFVINNMEQGIIIISENEEILLINDYAKEVLNISGKIEENINYHRVLTIELLLSNIEKAIKKHEDEYFDIVDRVKEKIYATSIDYLKNKWFSDNQEIGLFIVLMTDVTEKRTNDELKAEFISNASHELKSPITSIRGFSELLLAINDNADEKTKKYLNVIYNESIKMKMTIDELLYLSNLEYRRNLEGDKEKVYFKDVISSTVEAYTEQADKEYISIIVNVDENLYIYEQTNLLDHLISNLLSNAIKYNRRGGKVYINVEERDAKIILTVADTGIGIDEKDIDRIFERFYRIDQSHNRRKGGSGIGLNIVKQICNVLEAKLNVESKKDVGTKFIVEFKKNEEIE